ncbi:FAD-dependent oxidoreductase [Myxococcota bacterium]|nr:FAD-dependent oxidoreductase [Myxococcota bacterium]
MSRKLSRSHDGGSITRRRFLAAASAGIGAAAIAPQRVGHAAESRWDQTTDVLVVGLGGAGACAALEARVNDAEVLVLEASAAPGGSTAMSAGEIYLGAGTPTQRALGYEDTADAMYDYLMASCGPGMDTEKTRRYVDESVSHHAWLASQGVTFNDTFWPEHHDAPGDQGLRWSGSENAHPFSATISPAPRGHKVAAVGFAGGELMRILTDRVKKSGAGIHTSSRCLRLIADGENRVVGAVANMEGAEKRIRARRGVVITTGGFIQNREMLAHHAPHLLPCTPLGAVSDDGSGIQMGIGLGAASLHMDAAFVGFMVHPPEAMIEGIFVNQYGQRYINEDAYLGRVGHYSMTRADGDALLILDAGIEGEPFELAGLEKIGSAQSVEELERKTQIPSPALQHCLSFYNQYAKEGRDPLFGKHSEFLRPLDQMPLRAYRYQVGKSFVPAFTLGGLWTQPTGEVRKVDGSTIPGLYAAGRATSGVPARGYSGGSSIGDVTFFGRIAGRSAALNT